MHSNKTFSNDTHMHCMFPKKISYKPKKLWKNAATLAVSRSLTLKDENDVRIVPGEKTQERKKKGAPHRFIETSPSVLKNLCI